MHKEGMLHWAGEPACAWRGLAEHSRDGTLLREPAWCCCCHIAKRDTQAGWQVAAGAQLAGCAPGCALRNCQTCRRKPRLPWRPVARRRAQVCSAVLAPSRSMAGARRSVLLAAMKATPAVALPELTAAVMRRVYSVCAVCTRAQPQIRPRLFCSCLRGCLLHFVQGNAQLVYNACIAWLSEFDTSSRVYRG